MFQKYALPVIVALCIALAIGLGVSLNQDTNLTNTTTALNNRIDALSAEATASILTLQHLDAPYLLQPADGVTIANLAEAKLTWQWGRPLEANEYFDVRVWSEGQPAYGITWTKDPTYDMTEWLFSQQPAKFLWSIAVVKQTDAKQPVEEITKAGETRTFTVSHIAMDIMTVPDGFTSALWAKLPFTLPTVITFGDDGTVYTLGSNGQIAKAVSSADSSVADSVQVIYDDPQVRR